MQIRLLKIWLSLNSAVTVSYGADARAEDIHGNTPGHLAASKGHLAVLTALLQVSEFHMRMHAILARPFQADVEHSHMYDSLPGIHLICVI